MATLNDQHLKSKSIKNVLPCLSSLYTDAIEDGHVQYNPALKPGKLIKTAKRSEHVIPFTHEKEWRVLETTKAHCPHRSFYVVSHRLAGRRSGGLAAGGSGFAEKVGMGAAEFYSGKIVKHPEESAKMKGGFVPGFGRRPARLSGGLGSRSLVEYPTGERGQYCLRPKANGPFQYPTNGGHLLPLDSTSRTKIGPRSRQVKGQPERDSFTSGSGDLKGADLTGKMG